METRRLVVTSLAASWALAEMASGQIVFRRGTIASVSTTANSIVIYDQQGNVQNAVTSSTLNAPTDIAFAPDGTVLVVSTGDNVVYRLSLDGLIQATISDPQCPNPRGVAIGPEGDIYVTTITDGVHPSAVCRFSSDGSFETALAPGGCNSPRGLVFARNGHAFVCDYTAGFVREFDSSWVEVRHYSSSGSSLWPTALVFAPNGSFHVASRFPAQIYTITPGSGGSGMALTSEDTYGITMDGSGRLLVARSVSSTIGVYSSGVEVNALFSPLGAPPSGAVAIAPHRFVARLKGRVDTPFLPAQKINELVDLAIYPGTGRVTVRIYDSSSTVDFGSTIGVSYVVADGHFGALYPGETKRYINANEEYETSSGVSTTASIAGEVTGNWNSGFFSPTRAKLTLHWSRGDSVFAGTLTTLQLMP